MNGLHGYKKLIVFAIASGVVLAAGPLSIPAGAVAKIVGLASAYIIGQGIADHGKFRPRSIVVNSPEAPRPAGGE